MRRRKVIVPGGTHLHLDRSRADRAACLAIRRTFGDDRQRAGFAPALPQSAGQVDEACRFITTVTDRRPEGK